jgi:GntR family transcriptional regulator
MSDDTGDPRAPQRGSNADPLWTQAADLIAAEIRRRALPPGAKLPPERELCLKLGISRITLRKALGRLEEQGVVTASHGRGWFVAAPAPAPSEWPTELESFTATARRKRMRPSSLVLRQEVRPASFETAERLDVPAGTALFQLGRVRLLNDVRIAVEQTLLIADLVPGLDAVDFTRASLFEELQARDVSLDRSEATIESRTADHSVAQLLHIEHGAPLLVLDQTLYTRDQHPALLSTIEYSGDRYRLRTTFRPR